MWTWAVRHTTTIIMRLLPRAPMMRGAQAEIRIIMDRRDPATTVGAMTTVAITTSTDAGQASGRSSIRRVGRTTEELVLIPVPKGHNPGTDDPHRLGNFHVPGSWVISSRRKQRLDHHGIFPGPGDGQIPIAPACAELEGIAEDGPIIIV
jgi:hypothetical protein